MIGILRRWGVGAALAVALLSVVVAVLRKLEAEKDAELRAAAERVAYLLDRVHTLEQDTIAKRRRIDSLTVARREDNASLAKWRARWWALTQQVASATRDTNLAAPTDTLPPLPVIIEVADSTIGACTKALQTCDAQVAAERARGDNAELRAQLLRAAVDSLRHPPQKPLWYRATKRAGESWAIWRGIRAIIDLTRRHR